VKERHIPTTVVQLLYVVCIGSILTMIIASVPTILEVLTLGELLLIVWLLSTATCVCVFRIPLEDGEMDSYDYPNGRNQTPR